MLGFLDQRERTVFDRLKTWWLLGGTSAEQQALAADATVVLRSPFTQVDVDTTAADVTVVLPPVADCQGKIIVFTKTVAANTMTIDGNGTETINGATTVAKTSQWDSVRLMARNTTWRSV